MHELKNTFASSNVQFTQNLLVVDFVEMCLYIISEYSYGAKLNCEKDFFVRKLIIPVPKHRMEI